MTTNSLYVEYPAESACPDAMDVKKTETFAVLGERFTFRIIGNSHVITAPALGFAELVSCRPLGEHPTTEVPLTQGYHDTVTARTGPVTAQTSIRCLPLDAFPRQSEFSLQYRFAEDAYTTITLREDTHGYRTYHTYPGHDIAVYTQSSLTRHRESEQHDERSQQHTV